jgi:hypothetical protein
MCEAAELECGAMGGESNWAQTVGIVFIAGCQAECLLTRRERGRRKKRGMGVVAEARAKK